MAFTHLWVPRTSLLAQNPKVTVRTWDGKSVPDAQYTVTSNGVEITVPTANRYHIKATKGPLVEEARVDIPNTPNATSLEERVRDMVDSTGAVKSVGGVLPDANGNVALEAGSSTYELRGTGFPEGVVTASPGTYYTDSAGTNGAWRWVKKTGTGTTGWRVLEGDTGYRYLDETNFPNHGSTTGAIRRMNNRVFLIMSVGTVVYNTTILAIPAGFRGADLLNVGGQAKLLGQGSLVNSLTTNGSGGPIPQMVFKGSSVDFHGISTSGVQKVYMEWVETSSVWPTTLPGVVTVTA